MNPDMRKKMLDAEILRGEAFILHGSSLAEISVWQQDMLGCGVVPIEPETILQYRARMMMRRNLQLGIQRYANITIRISCDITELTDAVRQARKALRGGS